MIALWIALLFAPTAQSEPHIERARLALVGPLERVRIVAGANDTLLDAHLASGEHGEVVVPLVTSTTSTDPRVEPLDGGAADNARFVVWEPDFANATRAWWDSLSANLRARPRPSLPGSDAVSLGRPPAAALFVLLAFVPLALALRRRAKLCAVVSVVCAGALIAITLADRPPASFARILEGDGTTQRWFAVDCALSSLRIESAASVRLALEPAHAQVTLHTTLATADHGPWTLTAGRARLWSTSPCDPGERAFTPQRNAWGTLDECWIREADGVWSRLGPWEIGRPIPLAQASRGDPPGWLNPALPMGSAILIGRLAPGSFAGNGAANGPVWVRLVGF